MSEEKTYVLDNGQECSRAAYIRQEFMKNRSRADIAKELGVPYNVVYAATANMTNAHHSEKGEGGARGVMVEDPDTGELVPRAQLIRKMFENGTPRGEIAKHFGVAYGVVYAATKDMTEGKGGRVMITDPKTGELVPRIEYIRRRFAEGASRREIANEIGCDYSIVWMATREKKAADTDTEVGAEAEAEAPEVDTEPIEDLESETDPDYQG